MSKYERYTLKMKWTGIRVLVKLTGCQFDTRLISNQKKRRRNTTTVIAISSTYRVTVERLLSLRSFMMRLWLKNLSMNKDDREFFEGVVFACLILLAIFFIVVYVMDRW